MVGFSYPYKQTFSVKEFKDTFPTVLRDAGYYTGYIGKYHFTVKDQKTDKGTRINPLKVIDGVPQPEYEGCQLSSFFDEWRGVPGQGKYLNEGYYGTEKGKHSSQVRADQAIAFLREAKGRGEPFCLTVGFKAPHGPWREKETVDPRFYEWYRDVQMPVRKNMTWEDFKKLPDSVKAGYRGSGFNRDGKLSQLYLERQRKSVTGQAKGEAIPWERLSQIDDAGSDAFDLYAYTLYRDEEVFQETQRVYYSLVSGMDHAIGRIRAELETLGLAENTVVIYMSDNGSFLGARMLSGKELLYAESARCPLIVVDPRLPGTSRGATSDTLLSAIDIAPTLLELAGCEIPTAVQGRSIVPVLSDRSAVLHDAVFIENHYTGMGWGSSPESKRMKEELGNFESRAVVTDRYKYIRYDNTNPVTEELFDLKSDSDESTNVAANPEMEEVLEMMREHMRRITAQNDENRKTYSVPEMADEKMKTKPGVGTPLWNL
jgi:arylsulfatase A-like enzyme